ncbi:restriction endonuclease subunit S [uncultured Polaribacter sp.]|uniref:restriction endonuclease subunit S n=1 Tax=uncultured Polaribacter sp. TaxID=174711 RepID=UPI002619FA4C|nr:restriction endonuclease subunit S [uncultured Polaribacter sp.]
MIQLKKFGEVCDFVRGPFGGSLKKSCFVEKGYAVYEQQHAIYDQFSEIRYFVDQEKFNEMKRFELKSNDLIMSCSGTMGKVAIVPKNVKRGIINQALLKLTPKDFLDVQYLKYWMSSPDFDERIQENTVGAAIKNVASVKVLKQIDVPIPPLEEQKQIVALLDKAFIAIDQAKANIEKNIANAKELFQSKLNNIFSQKGESWEEKSLGELGKVSMCKRILKKQTTPDGEIPFYKIGTFGKEPNAFISKEIYDDFRSKYSFPKKGDILISASGTIGRRVIYNGEPAYFQDSNIVWIDNKEELVTNEYLYQFYGVCDWNPSKGATISRLYNADLRKIKISFPSIKNQKEIVPKMVKLNKQTTQIEANYVKKLKDLEELKKSILQKAFAGELTQKEIIA